jgi:hypothetical protein
VTITMRLRQSYREHRNPRCSANPPDQPQFPPTSKVKPSSSPCRSLNGCGKTRQSIAFLSTFHGSIVFREAIIGI